MPNTTKDSTYSLQMISTPTYKIDVPGFEHLLFSESSSERLTLPAAVKFNEEFGGSLQSAAKAVAFRIAANGQDHANEYQVTRTAAIYFKDGHQFYVAFDDDPKENILLARAQEGYDSHNSKDNWLVPTSDTLVKAALKRAEKNNRIVLAPVTDSLELRLDDGAYERDPLVQGMIGKVAPFYAAWLQQQGYNYVYQWSLIGDDCEQHGVTEKAAEIRCVVVVGTPLCILLSAYEHDSTGHTRRVRDSQKK
jgi:hypothetical protein